MRDTKILEIEREPIKVIGKNILPRGDSVEEAEEKETQQSLEKTEGREKTDGIQEPSSYQWQVANPREVTFPAFETTPLSPARHSRKKACKPLTISTLR